MEGETELKHFSVDSSTIVLGQDHIPIKKISPTLGSPLKTHRKANFLYPSKLDLVGGEGEKIRNFVYHTIFFSVLKYIIHVNLQ